MDYDGSNQKQMTQLPVHLHMPVRFARRHQGRLHDLRPGHILKIFIHSTETGRKLPFYNQTASLNAPGDFTPDGKQLCCIRIAGGRAATRRSTAPTSTAAT